MIKPYYKDDEEDVDGEADEVGDLIGWTRRTWTCEECGMEFIAKPTAKDGLPVPRRFCGNKCRGNWRRKQPDKPGCFRTGSKPWNKGVKGLRLSPATEFKKGNIPQTYVPVGTVVIRDQGHKCGRKQAFVKVAERDQWKSRALIVWEEHNGPLPDGYVLRHIDNNSLNDDIGNLVALTRAENLARTSQLSRWNRRRMMNKAWRTRRHRENRLQEFSVSQLLKLGYDCYCPMCYKPHKGGKLKCHRSVQAKAL